MNLLVNSSNVTDPPSNKYITPAIENSSQGIHIIIHSISKLQLRKMVLRELLKARQFIHYSKSTVFLDEINSDSCILRLPQNWFGSYVLHFHWGILSSARDRLMNLLPALAVVILSRALSPQTSVVKPLVRNSIRAKYNEELCFPCNVARCLLFNNVIGLYLPFHAGLWEA